MRSLHTHPRHGILRPGNPEEADADGLHTEIDTDT